MKYRELGAAVLCAAAFGACDAEGTPWAQPAPVEDAGPSFPPADVQLPPVPNLELADVPAVYDDGSFSVAGLSRQRADVMGQAVRVTAILQSVYECELPVDPEAPIEDPFAVRPGCRQHHMYFADTMRSQRKILVTGYDAAAYQPQLHVGERYVIHGTLESQTRGFLSSENGLIVADRFEGDGVEEPAAEPEAE